MNALHSDPSWNRRKFKEGDEVRFTNEAQHADMGAGKGIHTVLKVNPEHSQGDLITLDGFTGFNPTGHRTFSSYWLQFAKDSTASS